MPAVQRSSFTGRLHYFVYFTRAGNMVTRNVVDERASREDPCRISFTFLPFLILGIASVFSLLETFS